MLFDPLLVMRKRFPDEDEISCPITATLVSAVGTSNVTDISAIRTILMLCGLICQNTILLGSVMTAIEDESSLIVESRLSVLSKMLTVPLVSLTQMFPF